MPLLRHNKTRHIRQEWAALLLQQLCLCQVRRPEFPARDKGALKPRKSLTVAGNDLQVREVVLDPSQQVDLVHRVTLGRVLHTNMASVMRMTPSVVGGFLPYSRREVNNIVHCIYHSAFLLIYVPCLSIIYQSISGQTELDKTLRTVLLTMLINAAHQQGLFTCHQHCLVY